MHARSWSAGKTGVDVLLLLADEAWVVGAGIGAGQEEKERVRGINSRTGRDATCCCCLFWLFPLLIRYTSCRISRRRRSPARLRRRTPGRRSARRGWMSRARRRFLRSVRRRSGTLAST